MNISNIIQRLAGNYETRSTTNDTNAIKAPLKSVKIGDELKVQVLHIGEETSVVRLEDGSEISIAGRLPEDATEGTFLNILITDKGEGVPLKAEVLGTIKLAEDLNKQIESILKDLNIPNTKENFNLVIEMSKNNIPINKDTVSKAYEYVNTMNTDTENIMFLMKNDVEVSTTSVRAFDSMLSKSDFLETNLKVLIDTLTESINEINENINMNTLSSETDAGVKFVMGEKAVQNIISENAEVTLNVAQDVQNVEVAPEQTLETSAQILVDPKENVQELAQSNIEVSNIENIENKTVVNNANIEQIQVQTNEQEVQNTPLVKEQIQTATPQEENLEMPVISNENEAVQDARIMPKVTEEVLENAKVQEEAPVKTEITITKDSAVIKEETALQNNDSEIKQPENFKLLTPIEQKEKLERLREEVVGLFREVRNSKELGEEITQKRIFKSFKDVILDIEDNKEIFTKKTTETLTKEVTRMKENISLVSDLNKYNTIVHIPLMINDNKSLAELYVFNGDKENKGKKINENNATMFLSLGTANMGQIESYIKIVNKTIECNFMSESKLGVDIINQNKDHLAKLLDVYGYTLIKANADIWSGKSLNIFEAIEKNKKDEAKKGFDARA